MRKVLVLLLGFGVVFASPYFFVGVDVDGHIFPFIGLGTNAGNGFINFSLGVTHAEAAWAFQLKSEYFFEIYGFLIGGVVNTIAAFPESTTMNEFSIGPDNFLFLAGIKIGFRFIQQGFSLDLGVNSYLTMPFSATNEIEGPIPFIWMSIGQLP